MGKIKIRSSLNIQEEMHAYQQRYQSSNCVEHWLNGRAMNPITSCFLLYLSATECYLI